MYSITTHTLQLCAFIMHPLKNSVKCGVWGKAMAFHSGSGFCLSKGSQLSYEVRAVIGEELQGNEWTTEHQSTLTKRASCAHAGAKGWC